MTYRDFGDSISAGSMATVPANSYIGLLNAALGSTFLNSAVSSSMIYDQYEYIQAANVAAGDKSILWLGTNDQAKYDFDASKRQFFIDGMEASAIRLACDVQNVGPATANLMGSWSNAYAFSMYAATANGAKAAFTVNGPTAAICTLRQSNNSSAYQIWIDGQDMGVYYTAANCNTILGRSYGPRAHLFTGLGAGSHLIEVQALTASATYPVYLHWYSDCTPLARVVVPNIPHAIAYTYGGSTANVDAYNLVLQLIIAKLSGLGLDVHYVDVQSILLPSDMYDNVHPNDSGHLKVKNAILPVLTA